MAGSKTPERDGPAVAYEFPCFKDEDWHAFQRIIGAHLNSEERADIEEAANQCVAEHFFIVQDEQQKRQKGRVSKAKKPKHKDIVKVQTPHLMLLRAMRELFERWADVQATPEEKSGASEEGKETPEEKRVIEVYSDETGETMRNDLDRLMGELKVHEVALSNFLDRSKGRDPFIGLVGRLTAVFQSATGKQTTISMPKNTENLDAKQSPFVDFVKAVDECLPESARRSGVDTPSAKPQAVRRAQNKYKRRGNSPSKK